jgi:hypothetical protein
MPPSVTHPLTQANRAIFDTFIQCRQLSTHSANRSIYNALLFAAARGGQQRAAPRPPFLARHHEQCTANRTLLQDVTMMHSFVHHVLQESVVQRDLDVDTS